MDRMKLIQLVQKMKQKQQDPAITPLNYDPSLETTTPDIEYVNGIPTYKKTMLTHPLSYGNIKTNEANQLQPPQPVNVDEEEVKRLALERLKYQ